MAYNINDNFKGEGVTLSEIKAPRSLDEFDVNIIDLSSECIWRYQDRQEKINYEKEFKDLNRMIEESEKSEVVIILPQNIEYKNCYGNGSNRGEYLKTQEIKELIGYYFEEWISYIVQIPGCLLMYENTYTKIANIDYMAAFHFSNEYTFDEKKVLTRSHLSNKNTTLNLGYAYITTLKIDSYDKLIKYLDYIKLIEIKQAIPEWVMELPMFDDDSQKNIVKLQEEIIAECSQKIISAQERLIENNRYKSILYTNGDELVTVVFEILEKVLSCDLTEFKDEKKEDFLIPLEGVTFIGEIKGVTSNIKNEHVSQLDVHYQTYSDKLAEEQKNENIKALLIMDHQRSKDIADREPVHINQIKLAERNESLIIETSTLLKIFEKFLNETMSNEDIIQLFVEKKGLLEI